MNLNDFVMQTEPLDRQQADGIFRMSPRLKELEKKGSGALPFFGPLLGDLWASLFKTAPQLREQVPAELALNRSLMAKVMQEEAFRRFRSFTVHDELCAALGTIRYGETVLEWLKQQEARNQELADALTALRGAQDAEAREQAIQQAAAVLMQTGGLSQPLAQAAESAAEMKANLKLLIGGSQPGNAEAELKKVPLRDQLLLAEKLEKMPKLKKIAEWAGRFQLMAQKKQKSRYKSSLSRGGITQGGPVETLLPAELAAFGSPVTKPDFLRRFAEGQTLHYDTNGREPLGKGPVILCLDQSGSMRGQDMISKGFVLALMSLARRQRRDFGLILFSNAASDPLTYERGRISVKDMVALAETFRDGGTDFQSPLNRAAELIDKSRFQQADIVFLTDGEAKVSPAFLTKWQELKRKKAFHVVSLLLGKNNRVVVEKFSDKVVTASDLTDNKVAQVFDI